MPSRSLPCALTFLGLAACHDGSSGTSSAPAGSVNLGLAASRFAGKGDHWLVTVPEVRQGADLTGDGDLLDEVVHWVDLAGGTARNTGVAFAALAARTDVVPPPILAVGATFALGVDEDGTGGADLNGDGDALDVVLALVDPATGSRTDLGLAASRVVLAGEVVAFDVPELAQGASDLDGDGQVNPLAVVPHLHDLGTGVTRSSGLLGARVLSGDEAFVAMAELESRVGDRNGDGDALDLVLAFYDPATDVLASAGLALPSLNGLVSVPVPHRGHWVVQVDERAQGLGDLDGDGNPEGGALFVVEPRTGSSRNFPGLFHLPVAEVAPVVLVESQPGSFVPWLYDAESDQLVSTGRACATLQGFGELIVLGVLEAAEGQDLDGNGALDGLVPVVLDPATGDARSTAIDGLWLAAGTRLFIQSGEEHAQADWNDDGDREDVVLHVWDASTSELENTRLVLDSELAHCSDSAVLFLRSEVEAGADLNGDGDREDRVAQIYDALTRRVTNLGLATDLLLGIGDGQRGFLLVNESDQGTDLDGDGDVLDRVLHLVAP